MRRYFPQLIPKFLIRWSDRVLEQVPSRYRMIARVVATVAAVLFVAFEISRFWLVVSDHLLPLWAAMFQKIRADVENGAWLVLALTAVFFFAPIALLGWAIRRWRRREA